MLNENCMIGEDFLSRARENLLYARSLEQQIDDFETRIKKQDALMEEKDLQYVVQGRQLETFMMTSEEYLTHFDTMRDDRDGLSELSKTMTDLAEERKLLIEQIIEDHKEMERNRLESKKEAAC